MIDNSRQYSSSAPEPNTDYRIIDLNGKKSILVCRKRLKLRRIKSLSSVNSKPDCEIISTEENCSNRKGNERLFSNSGKKPVSLMLDRLLPGSDFIVSGTSSCGTSVRIHYPERVRSLEEHVEKGTCESHEGTSSCGTSVRIHYPERVRSLEERVEKGTCESHARTSVHDQRLQFLEESGEKEKITCVSHGSISVIGRRREMEDAVAIEEGFISKGLKKYDFFGVYDGHGGTRVAHACRERLHEMIIEEIDECVMDWEKVMMSSFRKMDDEVNRTGGAAVAMMGSAAIVAVVGEDELVVANCGDSRALLFQEGAIIALSNDHKMARIEDGGGKVINWNGQRVLGVLAKSRSIGDHCLKPFVISEPEVRIMRRTEKDEFIILGSEGLWDVISNELACEIVKNCFDGQLRRSWNDTSETGSSHAAALLAELAIARGSTDNISVIVIELQRFMCTRG